MASLAACKNATLQSVFDDLKKELQLRSVANGEFDSEHMETGVLMLGGPHPSCELASCAMLHDRGQPVAQLLLMLFMPVHLN